MAWHEAASHAAEGSSGPILFTLADVERKFTAETLRRGRAYARDGSVTKLEVRAGGRLLIAKVQGSARRPYSVTVSIEGRRPGDIQASCTCPVSFACKHCAAAMLAALGQGRGAKLPPPPPPDPLAGPVRFWLETLATVAAPTADRGPAAERILYILDSVATAGGRTAALQVIVTRPLKSGGMGAGRPYDIHNLTHGTAKFLTLEDALIGQLLTSRNYSYGRALPDDPAQLDLAFRRMVATGRCHYRDKDAPPLAEGPERPGRLTWSLGPTGEQRPTVEVDDPALTVLPCAAPWYVDPAANLAGPLAFAEPPRLVAAFLDAPPVAPEQGEAVRQYLASRLPGHTLPPPREEIAVATITDPPVPSLRLTSERVSPLYRYGYGSVTETVFDLALLGFDYGGTVLSGDKEPNEIRYAEEGRILVRRRDRKAERAARKRLEGLGFVPAGILPRGTDRRQRTGMALAGDEAAWHRFLHREVPALEAEGWRIETDPGFRHRVVEAEGDWEASLGEKSGWWFSLELGIDVEGERVPLLPVLAQAVRRMRAARDGEDLLQGETLYAPLPDGRTLALPTERVRPMLETLVELYDPRRVAERHSLDISLAQAAALAERRGRDPPALARRQPPARADRAPAPAGTVERGGAARRPERRAAPLPAPRPRLAALPRRARPRRDPRRRHGPRQDDPDPGPPPGREARRPARRAGARGLPDQRRRQLGGRGGALRARPARARASTAPTAPSASPRSPRPISCSRPTRSCRATPTRSLPVRAGSCVVLDEAQAIKNPASKAAQTACRLKARPPPLPHRHAGREPPGRAVVAVRVPDAGPAGRAAPLRPRCSARRSRSAATTAPPRAADPPAPVHAAPHQGAGRARAAAQDRDPAPGGARRRPARPLRDRAARHARARCGRRSPPRASRAAGSSCWMRCSSCARSAATRGCVKLDGGAPGREQRQARPPARMLPELLEEGRRVLLFSQFTTMLDLIRPELDARRHRLRRAARRHRGPRRRRSPASRPARSRCSSISLKAGGVGLNLTAADTVILYDPWWNPAVEVQATDRAHRIGQDKPVFVYKLIAEGTIEERMLELQARKRALADQLLDDARRRLHRLRPVRPRPAAGAARVRRLDTGRLSW